MSKCNAIIKFGDDFGDNCSTFHCQLEAGHEGEHKEVGNMGYGVQDIPYTLTWKGCSERDSWDYEQEEAEAFAKAEDQAEGDADADKTPEDEPEEPYADLVEQYDPEVKEEKRLPKRKKNEE